MDGNLSTKELLRFKVILHNRDTKWKEEVTVSGFVDFHTEKQYDKTSAMCSIFSSLFCLLSTTILFALLTHTVLIRLFPAAAIL